MARAQSYDLVVIGAGFFGVYAATHFAGKGARVLVVDCNARPWSQASLVNQARVHLGYHYPRSIATARLAHDYRLRFESEHGRFINDTFTHYYGVDKFGSLTGAEQFVRFCQHLDIPCQQQSPIDPFRGERLAALFKVHEPSFDPLLLRRHYLSRLEETGVDLALSTRVTAAAEDGERWRLTLQTGEEPDSEIDCGTVLNATYSNINAVNTLFAFEPLKTTYEMAEIAIIDAPALRNTGLTVMDGPYMSVMPFGCSSFHSLSSVLYTHHAVDRHDNPTFGCQDRRADCTPSAVKICTACPERPRTNYPKMLRQLSHYVHDGGGGNYHGSLFTIKTKLQSSHIDDARPTDMRVLRERPTFAYLFSGKINSIYEVERLHVQ